MFHVCLHSPSALLIWSFSKLFFFFFPFSVHSLHRQASNFVLHHHFPPHQNCWIWENSGLKCHEKSQRKTVADVGLKSRPFRLTGLAIGHDLINREKALDIRGYVLEAVTKLQGREYWRDSKGMFIKASLALLCPVPCPPPQSIINYKYQRCFYCLKVTYENSTFRRWNYILNKNSKRRLYKEELLYFNSTRISDKFQSGFRSCYATTKALASFL